MGQSEDEEPPQTDPASWASNVRLLHFQPSSLLTHPGRQQKAAPMCGHLPPLRETRIQTPGFHLAQLQLLRELNEHAHFLSPTFLCLLNSCLYLDCSQCLLTQPSPFLEWSAWVSATCSHYPVVGQQGSLTQAMNSLSSPSTCGWIKAPLPLPPLKGRKKLVFHPAEHVPSC